MGVGAGAGGTGAGDGVGAGAGDGLGEGDGTGEGDGDTPGGGEGTGDGEVPGAAFASVSTSPPQPEMANPLTPARDPRRKSRLCICLARSWGLGCGENDAMRPEIDTDSDRLRSILPDLNHLSVAASR